MSAIGMGRAAARKQLGTLEGSAQGFVSRLTLYIPADIVAGYVAVFALTGTNSTPNFAREWIVAGVFFVLTPFIVVTSYLRNSRGAGSSRSLRDWPWFKIVASMIAYVVWVFALPQTPFNNLADVTGFWQTLVLVAGTTLLAGMGSAIDDPAA